MDWMRDVPDWLALSYGAKALYLILVRRADARGCLELGQRGHRALPGVLGHPDQDVGIAGALDELLEQGHVVLDEGLLRIVDYRKMYSRKPRQVGTKLDSFDSLASTTSNKLLINQPPCAAESMTCCKDSVNPILKAEHVFCAEHKRRLGVPYTHNYARDRKILKRLPAEYHAKLLPLITRFFDRMMTGSQREKFALSIPWFVYRISTLLDAVDGSQLDWLETK